MKYFDKIAYIWALVLMFVLGWLLVGCTSPQTADYQRQIASYTAILEKEFNIKVTVPVKLVKHFTFALPMTTVAVCYKFDKDAYPRFIEILESKLNDNFSLQQCLEHELGHYVFNLQHYDKDVDIMNTYVLNRDYYLEHRRELIYNVLKRLKK